MLAVVSCTLGWTPLATPLAVRPRVQVSHQAAMVIDETTRDASPSVGGAAVTSWQPAAFSSVVSTLGLTEKPYAADLGFDSFSMAGSTGEIKSFEGPGLPNVAWCSGLTLQGGETACGSITAFCGPLTDVPHLVASCTASSDGVDLYIDFRPRAEGAYDPQYATLAEYPEPETREAFAEGGNRKDFASAFFTEEVEAWRASLLALGTPAAPLSKEQTSTISAGPMLIDVKLPPTEEAAQAAADACASAVDRWLTWMTTADEMNRGLPAGMRQTATYTRDTKVRANHFGFLLGRYTARFGDVDGKALATADAGPLDEAYVGGGS